MIQHHLYAKLADTRVYAHPADESAPLGTLPQGTWLGVIARQGEWARVITHHAEGWVRISETEERSPYTLHARWKPGMHPQYVSLAG